MGNDFIQYFCHSRPTGPCSCPLDRILTADRLSPLPEGLFLPPSTTVSPSETFMRAFCNFSPEVLEDLCNKSSARQWKYDVEQTFMLLTQVLGGDGQ